MTSFSIDRCSLLAIAFAAAAFAAGPLHAKVSQEEAARLGRDLTPLGAERAGNAAGTIPAWTGGITEPPAGYVPGRRHPDPFADDPVLFTIDASNVDEHAQILSAGHLALLQNYPETYRMNVYPTRRSASYPEWVYEAIVNNATAARVVLEGKGGVEGARVSSPFPIPKSGVEMIWNHNLRWRGVRISRVGGDAAVTTAGRFRVTKTFQEIGIPYGTREISTFSERYPNVMFAIKEKVFAPSLQSGEGALVIETINQTQDPRKAWSYSRALRRVLRNPYVAYDFPAADSASLRTVDDTGLFIGPPDRFDWKVLGKRELLIPYNAYRLHAGDIDSKDIIRPFHIEPDLCRYELHRVWVLEATLKPDKEHIYHRRVFYLDEDSWQIHVAESYDSAGKLWRVNEAHGLNYYEVPVHWDTLQVYHDLHQRRYAIIGLDNDNAAPRFRSGGDPREFNPNALLYYVR